MEATYSHRAFPRLQPFISKSSSGSETYKRAAPGQTRAQRFPQGGRQENSHRLQRPQGRAQRGENHIKST